MKLKIFTKDKLREVFSLLKETFQKWNDSDPWRLSAVVAYYAIFSLPGLIIIVIKLAGYFFGEAAASGEVYAEINDLIGKEGARQVQVMVEKANNRSNTVVSTIVGVATLLFASTGVFFHLKQSINQMWGVKPQPKKAWLKLIKDRAFSFGMIGVIGFLLLISLVISSILTVLGNYLTNIFPEYTYYLLQIANIIISLAIITFLFAVMYKVLPDVIISWKDVFVGAFVTAVLFVLGKTLIGFYLGKSDPGSGYGAAGSIILILTWVSYSSLILFFGAAFTEVYGKRYGSEIKPAEFAVKVPGHGADRAIDKDDKQEEKSPQK